MESSIPGVVYVRITRHILRFALQAAALRRSESLPAILVEPSVLMPIMSHLPAAQVDGGEGGIRTHEGRKPLPVFKTGAFNRSATSPYNHPSCTTTRI